LVEGEDVDVVALVLLDDALGVVFGVERIHEDKWDIAAVRAVEELARVSISARNCQRGRDLCTSI
jgi:hypothetical protein